MALPRSDDELLLLHNPRCSKSRATRALLEDRGVAFAVRLYLDDPLTTEELSSLASRLGRPLSAFVRTKEPAFAESGCSTDSTEAELAAAVAANPILLERPILIRGGRAAVGRPPEAVLALL